MFFVVETFNDTDADVPGKSSTLDELNLRVGPSGRTLADNFTVPLRPFRLDMVIADIPEEPGAVVRALGVALSEKSRVDDSACGSTENPVAVVTTASRERLSAALTGRIDEPEMMPIKIVKINEVRIIVLFNDH